jgi:hypothetical protein
VSVVPLPRSLDPLPAESLAGFVLRLAHRLDMSPIRLAITTGLDHGRRQSTLASSVILALDPQVTATFAHACRLTTAEVTDLTLASLASRYPPLDLQTAQRRRQVHGVFIKENWIFARSTRYCPGCLAGDGSLIQRRHGGAWSKLWRLPVVFACPLHRRLLHHLCPSCHAPVHQRRAGSPQLLPLAAHPVVHPAACRNPTTPKQPYQPCGHRLDGHVEAEAEPGWLGDEPLRLQQRLLALLGPGIPHEVYSVGQPSAPARYFVDLRIMTALLQASWPAARDVVPPADAALIESHLRRAREQIAAVEAAGGRVHHMRVYDKPPLDAATTCAMLGAADRILAGDPTSVRGTLGEMFDAVPFARAWTRTFLAGDGHCSPGLQIAAGTEAGARHVIRRAGLPGRPVRPAPRLVDFGVTHIPQYLPIDWYDTYLAALDIGCDADVRWLRRAVPVLLARMRLGGSIPHAASALGLPASAGRLAVTRLATRLQDRPGQQTGFTTGIEALAVQLHSAAHRVNYGRRRQALTAWTLDAQRWREMIHDRIGQPVNGKASQNIDWGDRKRLLASVWIWTRVTDGEMHFAPLLRPDHTRPKSGSALSIYVHARWPFLVRGQGHYADLRPRLDAHADRLAEQIDHPGTLTPSQEASWSRHAAQARTAGVPSPG